jgi:hypothetical protein
LRTTIKDDDSIEHRHHGRRLRSGVFAGGFA